MREETINALREFYIPERVARVDADFLEFEEEMASEEDLGVILEQCLNNEGKFLDKWDNTYNSIILFVVGRTDQFDFYKGRSDTIDGSPPDIDIDFDALDKHKAIDWVVDHWGRENVAQIGTFQEFKPRGMVDDWHRIYEKSRSYTADIKDFIPPDHAGKTAKLADVVKEHPDFPKKYPKFYNAATKLEGMYAKEGIHAAGIVISDAPVSDTIPIRMKKNEKLDKYHTKKVDKWVTQLDMHETEELGLIKFDFLSIENLDIIKEACRLIEQEKGLKIDPYSIPDGDEKTYQLLHNGFVTGVFQMETSGSAKDLLQRAKPSNIEELSDINALNRPGPMQAGLTDVYIENKANGYAPQDLPDQVAEVLSNSWWTLVYQEQVMKLATDLAGFTLQEADDVRRAMGKKKKEVLDKWQERFINGCVEVGGLNQEYAEELWTILAGDGTDRNAGFADYCLAEDTRIKLNGGGTLTIRQIVDQFKDFFTISTYENEEVVATRPTQFWNRGEKECVTYTFEDDSTITCTPDHHFLTIDKKWVAIQEAADQNLDLIKV